MNLGDAQPTHAATPFSVDRPLVHVLTLPFVQPTLRNSLPLRFNYRSTLSLASLSFSMSLRCLRLAFYFQKSSLPFVSSFDIDTARVLLCRDVSVNNTRQPDNDRGIFPIYDYIQTTDFPLPRSSLSHSFVVY